MKCENCGKNEVTFIYQSNINGKVTEKHLCSECAEKLGYTQKIAAHNQRMMQNFFGGSLFGNNFFDDFFSPMPGLMGRMNRMLELDREYPQYQLARHKGYPTKLHYELIAQYGIQPFYRRSFLKKQGYWHA